jgi:hypothetical protein
MYQTCQWKSENQKCWSHLKQGMLFENVDILVAQQEVLKP